MLCCLRSFTPSIIRLRSFDLSELIFCFPVDYKLPVLMPSSLLYLPSMTSICCLLNIFQQSSVHSSCTYAIRSSCTYAIRCLLNIFQQSPPLALMAIQAPACIRSRMHSDLFSRTLFSPFDINVKEETFFP
jgi:hypothetical protein